jgi:hypothetical protein
MNELIIRGSDNKDRLRNLISNTLTSEIIRIVNFDQYNKLIINYLKKDKEYKTVPIGIKDSIITSDASLHLFSSIQDNTLPELEPYLTHGNKFALTRDGIFSSIFPGMDYDDFNILFSKLFTSYDMPSGGQNIGLGEVLFLILFKDVKQTKGDQKGDLVVNDIKLEIKDGKPRMGSGSTYSQTAPGRLLDVFTSFYPGDKDNFKSRVMYKYHRRRVDVEQMKVAQQENNNILYYDNKIRGNRNLDFPVPASQIRKVFLKHDNFVCESELPNLFNKEIVEHIHKILPQRGSLIKVKKIPPKKDLDKIHKRCLYEIDNVLKSNASVGGVYEIHVKAFFRYCYEKNNKLMAIRGLYELRNYEYVNYNLLEDCVRFVNEVGLKFIASYIKSVIGALHLVCYHDYANFDRICFISNTTKKRREKECIIIDTKSFGESRLCGVLDFIMDNNMVSDLSIDGSRNEGVHLWYNGSTNFK